MTEKELAQLEQYHRHMINHHKKMMSHYSQRKTALRLSVAQRTSKRITDDILEKLQNEQASR